MKSRPQGFRRIYSGTADTDNDAATQQRMMSSGYDTYHRQKRRETILLVAVIGLGVVGALAWLCMSVIPNLDLF